MPRNSLQALEDAFPEIRWQQPARIVIAPERDGEPSIAIEAPPDQWRTFGGTPLDVCRVCIANYGFKAAGWEDCQFAWEKDDSAFIPHMADHLRGEV